MNQDSFAFLKALEEAPSVSGYEQPAARIVRERMKRFATRVTTDLHGNVIASLEPATAKKGARAAVSGRLAVSGGCPRIMLAGHMDQIGFLVKYINPEGFIHLAPVGGHDNTVLPGSRVTIHTRSGPVEGVIGRKPVHLMKQEERGQGKIELHDLAVDIGAKNKDDALKRVAIADPITFRLGLTRLTDDVVCSPGLDNKVGTFVVMEALRLCSEMRIKCSIHAVATVQEEIGLRGARTACYGIDPSIGIAVDVTHASDYAAIDKRQVGEVNLGKGPVIDMGANINPILSDLFLKTAKKNRIPHQLAAAPGATGTDANAMQISRAGLAAALISIPNRYMHTPVELCSLSDLEHASELIAATIAQIDSRTDFCPM